MKAHTGVALIPEEVDYVYNALTHLINSHMAFQSWLESKDGKPLPGTEIVTKEMDKEIAALRELRTHIFSICFRNTQT